jgi:3-hydroxyisobutyrate dehydrogenase-like beta-hydroxyacid dehydrogenase
MSSSTIRIGMIGTGEMGTALTQRLLLHPTKYEVYVHNRTKEKAAPLITAGARWSDTPCELSKVCEIVISMLTNTEAVKQILIRNDGVLSGLKAGSLFVDMSTIDPSASAEFAEHLKHTVKSLL